jgi:hypothetical protein
MMADGVLSHRVPLWSNPLPVRVEASLEGSDKDGSPRSEVTNRESAKEICRDA